MRFEIEAAGRIRTVEIEPQGKADGTAYLVTVDGRPHDVEVAHSGHSWSLLIGTRSYEVAFERRPAGETLVYVDGHPVSTRRAGLLRPAAHSTDARVGPQAVVAPMPGRILKVLVKKGDAVAARQGLVVVEAMKMENELRSPKAGTVVDVRVSDGTLVEAGAVLVIVD